MHIIRGGRDTRDARVGGGRVFSARKSMDQFVSYFSAIACVHVYKRETSMPKKKTKTTNKRNMVQDIR